MQSSKNKKRELAKARDPSPWPCAHAAALFHTLRTSLTVNVNRWSQERDASESMEAHSTLTTGNNVLRVRARGAQERIVAAIATAQAGCTPATGEGARTNTRHAERSSGDRQVLESQPGHDEIPIRRNTYRGLAASHRRKLPCSSDSQARFATGENPETKSRWARIARFASCRQCGIRP